MIYKVLGAGGESCHGGDAAWSLPTQDAGETWTPGEWMPDIDGELSPCENGYHLAVDAQVLEWLGPVIYEAEYEGERLEIDDKIVVRRARLTRRIGWDEDTARQFARWCALEVAHLWNMPDVVRQYLETGDEALRNAAMAAARATAEAAASAAAWDAVWTATSAAAWAAAYSAAWAAVKAASNGAPWAAAWAAVRAAANCAALAVTEDAARAAARAAQYTEFCRLTAGRY